MTTLLWLTIALPLIGATVLLLGGYATDAWGHLLGCAAVIGSFLCGVVLFVDLLGRPADDRVIGETLFSWVPVGVLQVDFGLQLDTLSVCFLLLITGVGPSMASPSQDCSGTWALLPQAPSSSSRPTALRVAWPINGAAWNTTSKLTDPTVAKSTISAMARPMSPTRLTMKAFLAAAAALRL